MSKLNKVIEDLECLIEEMGEDGYHGSESVIKAHDHLIKYEDLLSYDESKERELFIAEFKLEGKIYYDENTKQWLPTSDTIKGFQMAERTLGCWIGWSACAKSRAGIQS